MWAASSSSPRWCNSFLVELLFFPGGQTRVWCWSSLLYEHYLDTSHVINSPWLCPWWKDEEIRRLAYYAFSWCSSPGRFLNEKEGQLLEITVLTGAEAAFKLLNTRQVGQPPQLDNHLARLLKGRTTTREKDDESGSQSMSIPPPRRPVSDGCPRTSTKRPICTDDDGAGRGPALSFWDRSSIGLYPDAARRRRLQWNGPVPLRPAGQRVHKKKRGHHHQPTQQKQRGGEEKTIVHHP